MSATASTALQLRVQRLQLLNQRRELRLRRRIDQLAAVRDAKERRILFLEAELRRAELALARFEAAA